MRWGWQVTSCSGEPTRHKAPRFFSSACTPPNLPAKTLAPSAMLTPPFLSKSIPSRSKPSTYAAVTVLASPLGILVIRANAVFGSEPTERVGRIHFDKPVVSQQLCAIGRVGGFVAKDCDERGEMQ